MPDPTLPPTPEPLAKPFPTTAAITTTNDAVAAATNKYDLVNKMAVVAQKDATAVPGLISDLATLDPTLVAPVESKALIASKSPAGTFIVSALAYVSAKYGFGWDQTTDALMAGGGLLLGAYIMRYITEAPISGLFTAKKAS